MKKLIVLLLIFFNARAFGYGDSTHGQPSGAPVSQQQIHAARQYQKSEKKVLKAQQVQQQKQQKQLQQQQYKSERKRRQ